MKEDKEKAFIFIPARYESKRFEGKLLAPLCGKPVIEWVYKGAMESRLASGVYVVTDSERIKEAVEKFGGAVLFRKKHYECGTDRIADVVKDMDVDIVINLQGDEPLVKGEVLDQLIMVMKKEKPKMATLARKIESNEELHNPNVVKVVCDKKGFALYFSRALIPFNATDSIALKHIGIYAFTRDSILEFTSLPQGDLEKVERLEQLRALEAGWKVKVVLTDKVFIGVDTPEDLKRVEEFMKKS
jgi:3-deoxy-manno-octulosonate cytidylyltransferase (CMP-KDO synthetase)